jgi:hypothetical protein
MALILQGVDSMDVGGRLPQGDALHQNEYIVLRLDAKKMRLTDASNNLAWCERTVLDG